MRISSTCLLLLVAFTISCGRGDTNSIDSIESGDFYSSVSPVPGPIPGSEATWPAPPGIGITQPNYRPLNLSDKVFRSDLTTYAPGDILEETVTLEFDVTRQQTRGEARIKFKQSVESQPVFLFEGTVLGTSINGQSVPFSWMRTPNSSTVVLALQKTMKAGEVAEAVITFSLPSDRTTYSSGGVAFLTAMADLVARFSQRYWPTGFEDDAHALTLRLKVLGGSNQHALYANGEIHERGAGEWEIRFPSYYSLSSFYVHLTDRAHVVDRFTVQGMTRQIPVTVYASSASLVQAAKAQLPALFQEMEEDYGPYSHPEFIAYIVTTSGGMEHVGATVTHLSSLAHELLHSWFARGVMPAEGRSGWIDEAIADWRGKGYQRATSLLQRSPTALATASPFTLSTPMNSYQDGRLLMAELDLYFADLGGMKPILKAFMERYRYSQYTTEEFKAFIENHTGRSVEEFFNRYVYGAPRWRVSEPLLEVEPEPSDHPRPFTDEEIAAIR